MFSQPAFTICCGLSATNEEPNNQNKEVHLTRHLAFGDQIISDHYRGCYLRGRGRVRIILSLKELIRKLLLCTHLSQFPLLLT